VKRAQKPVLLHDLGKNETVCVCFKEITNLGGPYFQDVHQGRGAFFADFNNDGRIDMALVHLCQPATLLKNDADTGGNHWLGVELRGKNHRDVDGRQDHIGDRGGYTESVRRRRRQLCVVQFGGTLASALG
jgi:hypothetical protein